MLQMTLAHLDCDEFDIYQDNVTLEHPREHITGTMWRVSIKKGQEHSEYWFDRYLGLVKLMHWIQGERVFFMYDQYNFYTYEAIHLVTSPGKGGPLEIFNKTIQEQLQAAIDGI